MTSVEFKVDPRTARFVRSLEGTRREKVYQSLDRFFGRQAAEIATHVIRTKLSGQLLNRRTGQLAQGTIGMAHRSGGVPGLKVGVLRGPARAYAHVQEDGATIRPKTAKALAIPQGPALTPAGVDRYGSPRNFPGELRFIPFRDSGVAVGGLFTDSGVGLGELAYVLVREVRIEGVKFLHEGFYEKLPGLIRDLELFLGRFLDGGSRSSRGRRGGGGPRRDPVTGRFV